MGDEKTGVVLGACGDFHVKQAIRVCSEIRDIHPDLPVDLFTDQAGVELVGQHSGFARIHEIEKSWFRPKMDALIQSRFEKTLYLDNDMFILAPFDDVFQVLDRYDIALCHDPNRAGKPANVQTDRVLPNAMPQFNGGLLAVRRQPETLAFLNEWSERLQASGQGKDQPLLRQLLHLSSLRLGILPEEYNLLHSYSDYVFSWLVSPEKAAPRIYHHYPLRPEEPEQELLMILGPRKYRALLASLNRDPNIAPSSIRPEFREAAHQSLMQVEGRYLLLGWPANSFRTLRKRLALGTRWRQWKQRERTG